MCWKAAFSAAATACASTSSSSTRETGNHLWAERFDKPLADLFDMQDEIVARLASKLSTQFVAAEARRAEQAPHPDSMDLYFQGMAWVNKGSTAGVYGASAGIFRARLGARPRQYRGACRRRVGRLDERQRL